MGRSKFLLIICFLLPDKMGDINEGKQVQVVIIKRKA
jgi:hypothetical protein